MQLPKKEAGAGMAFGGGATDALFGAGSGNALTKITKYSAGVFFGLVIVLSMLQIHAKNERQLGLRNAINSATVEPQTPAATTAPATATPPPATPSGYHDRAGDGIERSDVVVQSRGQQCPPRPGPTPRRHQASKRQ